MPLFPSSRNRLNLCALAPLFFIQGVAEVSAQGHPQVNRTPEEKAFISGLVIRDGLFGDLAFPDLDFHQPDTTEFEEPERTELFIVRPRFSPGINIEPRESLDEFLIRVRNRDDFNAGLARLAAERVEKLREIGNAMDRLNGNGDRPPPTWQQINAYAEEHNSLMPGFSEATQLAVYYEHRFDEVTNGEPFDITSDEEFEFLGYTRALREGVIDDTSGADVIARMDGAIEASYERLQQAENAPIVSDVPNRRAMSTNISTQGTLFASRPQIRSSVTYTDTATGGAAARSGHALRVAIGISHPVSDTVTLGAGLSLTEGENNSAALATTLDSRKVGLSTSARIKLPQDTLLTFSAAYIHGDHNISITGFTGSFTTQTVAAAARIERKFKGPGGWNITPSLGTSYASLDRSTYVNTAGRTILGSTEELGLVQAAVRFDKQIAQGRQVYAPWVELGGDWLFDAPGDSILNDGTVLSTDDTGYNLAGGIDFAIGPLARGTVSTTYRQQGKSDSWTVGAEFRHDF